MPPKLKNTRFEEPSPPAPPTPSIETLLGHKGDKPLWSELNWLTNYKPKIIDKIPNWRNCKLL